MADILNLTSELSQEELCTLLRGIAERSQHCTEVCLKPIMLLCSRVMCVACVLMVAAEGAAGEDCSSSLFPGPSYPQEREGERKSSFFGKDVA